MGPFQQQEDPVVKSQLSRIALSAALVISSLPTVGLSSARTAPPSNPPPVGETKHVTPDAASVSAAFGALPLAFEPNRGQVRPEARYVARGAGYTLFVTDREIVTTAGDAVVRMDFPAARCITASSELPGRSNYFLGNDPAKWISDVPMFERTTLEAVFPGIDLVVYGSNEATEYDFVVAPGADPSSISVTLEGASSMHIDESGDLVLVTRAGEIRHNRPVLYQLGADGRREPVSGAFRLGRGRVSFNVGAYDRTRPLVIDPVLKFSTYLGGKKDDEVKDVAVDAAGNVYVTGATNSRDFPVRNAYEESALLTDVFVSKFNPTGTSLVFSTLIGGAQTDEGAGIDVDPAGRIFVAGSSTSQFYPMKNAYQIPTPITNYPFEVVFTVLTPPGNEIYYSTALGGFRDDFGFDVAVDIHGNAFVCGSTNSERFPVKSPSELPPFQSEPGGGEVLNEPDGFVAKFDPDEEGNTSLVYSTLLGGSDCDTVESVRVDRFERAYVTGLTLSSDFPVTNAVQPEFAGDTDAFVTKFNADGTTVFYSTYLGGRACDDGFSIAIDESVSGDPEASIAGLTESDDFPVANAFQDTLGGGIDAFVTRLSGDGRSILYSTFLGGTARDEGHGIDTDRNGDAIVTGIAGEEFPLLDPALVNGQVVRKGLFVAKFDGKDGSLVFSTCIGDADGISVAVDVNGDAYAVGQTVSNVFPVTPGAFQTTRKGDIETVVLKLDIVNDDTVGVWNPTSRTFLARNNNLPGAAELTVQFGVTGDRPLSGDWNGDGVDTIGVYTPSQGRFSLRNTNTPGAADLTFVFGAPNLQPLEGDWDGDGDDTIGVFDPATNSYFLRNSNDAGAADIQFTFGAGGQGAIAIAGDWNGDGIDTVGFYVPATREFFLINVNAGGNADLQFVFGPNDATPVAGDWNADTFDTVGVVAVDPVDGRKTRFSLADANVTDSTSLDVTFGLVGELPVVGNWDGQ